MEQTNQASINKLLDMQKQLMDEVPHGVKSDTLIKMAVGIKIIDALLRYLNSTGHKPWRPIPLPTPVQDSILKELEDKVGLLGYIHTASLGTGEDFSDLSQYSRHLISGYGVIEEVLEYLNSLAEGTKGSLEELTDILFFYLELIILGRFGWAEIEEEYVRKHAENLERYRRGKEGDYGWDKRGEKEGL